MMFKKTVFHLTVSIVLFCLIIVNFNKREENIAVYRVDEFSVQEVPGDRDDGIKCVGKAVEPLNLPERIIAGQTVSLKFKGERYTEYNIKFYYPDSDGNVMSFSPVRSNSDGEFSWNLQVNENVMKGKIRIIVLGNGSFFSAETEIVD